MVDRLNTISMSIDQDIDNRWIKIVLHSFDPGTATAMLSSACF